MMYKAEMLRRLGRLLSEMRKITAYSRFLGEETADLEFDILQIEIQLAKMIDDYMAHQYAAYNRRQAEYGHSFTSHTG